MLRRVQPYLPPLIVSRIKEGLACGLIGVVVAACVYGITVLQAYIYFRNNVQNSVSMRLFVAFLFILDTVSLVLAIETIYEYVVIDFGDPLRLINMPPALAIENATTVLIGTLTQLFLAHRLWELSKGNVTLVCSIIILALCSFGPGMVLSVKLYTHRVNIILEAWSTEGRTLGSVANGLSAICDIAIAAALCYYLHSKKTGFRTTNSMIDQLIMYAVNRGALTAICQALEMIMAIALPDRYIYLPFAILSGKLYFNTLLATLNAQKSIRKDGDNVIEVGTLPSFNRTDANRPRHSAHTGETTRTSENVGASGLVSGVDEPKFVMDIYRSYHKIAGL